MLKKLLLLGTVLSTASAATDFEGPYAGAQAVTCAVSAKHSIASKKTTNKSTLGNHTVGTGIFGGYGKALTDSFYVGGEVYSTFINHRIIINTNKKETFSVKNDGNTGVKVRLGCIPLRSVLLYVGTGPQYSKWIVEYKDEATNCRHIEKGRYKLYFTPFVGVEVKLTDHMTIRGEYKHTKAPLLKVSDQKGKNKEKIAMQQSCFNLGVAYIF